MADGRVARGARTRLAVLDTAVALSSVYGLNAMSLARLADETGVSKSGLFTHWPDKEILQLAIVEHAERQWTDEIVTPALAMPRGVRRLWALHEGRLAYYTSRALPGGCFFVASRAEFDDRPGPVRDALTTAIDAWWDFLQRSAEQAVELGELYSDTDAAQLAFEIDALGEGAVTSARLHSLEQGAVFARRAVLDRLRALSPTPHLLPGE
jgi:AcrR family transcriptional regulator